MSQQREPGLSLAEWLVLCLVSEEATHCFAIAGLLAEDGSLGRVWHVQKAVVYRAAQRLEQLGLIMASEKQPSAVGPARALLHATPEGHEAAAGWLR
jgi:DNA-binding PadR family transcriptional regulator